MKRLGIAVCVALVVLGIACDPDAQPDAAPPSSGPIVKTKKAPPPIVNKDVSGSKVAVPERKSSAATRPARPPLALWSGVNGAIEENTCLRILSEKEWRALWLRHYGLRAKDYDEMHNEPCIPAVDFRSCMAIGIFRDSRGRRGIHGIRVYSTAEDDAHVRIRFDVNMYGTTGVGRLPLAIGQTEREKPKTGIYGIMLIPRSSKTVIVERIWTSDSRGNPTWRELVRFPPLGAAKKELEANLPEFTFSLVYVAEEAEKGFRFRLTTDKDSVKALRVASWKAAALSVEEAQAVINRLAKSGFLDRPGVPPPGEWPAGWNMHVGRHWWFLGKDIGALLEQKNVLRLRNALSGKAGTHFDTLISLVAARVREAKRRDAAQKK